MVNLFGHELYQKVCKYLMGPKPAFWIRDNFGPLVKNFPKNNKLFQNN